MYKVVEKSNLNNILYIGNYKQCEIFKIKNKDNYTFLVIQSNL